MTVELPGQSEGGGARLLIGFVCTKLKVSLIKYVEGRSDQIT